MTRQYLRNMTLSLGGQPLVTLGDDASACLRVRFKVSQMTIASPVNKAIIEIVNLSDAHASAIAKSAPYSQTVELQAGYDGNQGTIFSGKLLGAAKRRESVTDTVLILTCADGGDAIRQGTMSTALAKGSTPADHVDAFIKAWQPYGITKGYIPPILSQTKYPRGVSLFGMVRDNIDTLAHSYKCSWSIQNGKLNMVPANGTMPGGTIVLNSSSGLIGMPEQTQQGVHFDMLINSSMYIDRQVQINQKDINQASVAVGIDGQTDPTQVLPPTSTDGNYRVYFIETTGDTRGKGNDWIMSCLGVPTGYTGLIGGNSMQSAPFLYPHAATPDLNAPR